MKRKNPWEVGGSRGWWTRKALGDGAFWRGALWVGEWLWLLTLLPLHMIGMLERGCITVAEGVLRIVRTALFAGIGFLLIASLCLGLGSVLLYPWWH